MKQKVVISIKLILVFTVTVFSMWLLLFLSALIPNKHIKENMKDSVYYFSDKDAYQLSESGRFNEITDNYADCISLNIAWNIGKGNPFTSSIDTDYYDGEFLGPNAGLYYTVMEDVEPNNDYTRYWHGSSIFIRILSLFTDLSGIRMIGFIVLIILICVTLAMLIKKKHVDLAVLLIISLVAIKFWNVRLSMEYQSTFILVFMLIPIYLLLEKRNDNSLVYLSVFGGAITGFFDFLTTETIVILLPLMLVLVVRVKEGRNGRLKDEVITSVKSVIAWGIAYIGAFITKWTVASIVTRSNAFSKAISSVSQRVGGQIDESEKEVESIFAPIYANLTTIFGGDRRVDYTRMIFGAMIVVFILISVWYLLRDNGKNAGESLYILCLSTIVFIRFMVLSNHSYLHCFFTHRALIVVVFGLLAAMWLNIELPKKKGRRK